MGRNSHYFNNKNERIEIAKRHLEKSEKIYAEKIRKSVKQSKIYGPHEVHVKPSSCKYKTLIEVVPLDSVEAIRTYKENGSKLAVLNFASYKNPGGMFLNGSKAQEECLCHESFLFSVLKSFDNSFYEWNRANKNLNLYRNRAIYSPDVVFMGSLANDNGKTPVEADVITCAAPNFSAAEEYCGVTREENYRYCYNRVKFLFDIAAENNVDILILGAWGGGVFGQDSEEMANIFKSVIETSYSGRFKKIIFAIPKFKTDNNLELFKKVFER